VTDLDVIMVTHNSEAVLGSCLEALGDVPTGFAATVTVVDSGSLQPPSTEGLHGFAVDRLVSLANVGYGTACNVGAGHATGRWIAFLNPDVFVSWEQLRSLVAAAESRHAAAAGPTLTDSQDVMRPRPVRSICPPWRRRHRGRLRTFPDGLEVEVIPGAVLLVRRDYFDAVAGFDTGFFLYGEEDDLITRVRERGGLAFVSTTIRVAHVDEASSANVDPRWRTAQRLRGKTHYVRKHFSAPEAAMSATVDVVRLIRRSAAADSVRVLRHALRRPRPRRLMEPDRAAAGPLLLEPAGEAPSKATPPKGCR
jgi:N-acetylglucosaminyl-diphospho-decaprenol L-rhamnosyltransferase